MKREKRRKEHKWHRLKTESAYEEFKEAKNRYIHQIRVRKSEYYKLKISEAGSNMNKLYKLLNGITGKTNKKSLPDGYSGQDLANAFRQFFRDKINNITAAFEDMAPPFPREVDIQVDITIHN